MPRHKEFDPDEALGKAMHVFWRKGYEGTSIQDLVEAMGINRFSLYATFGDKHALYLAAVERYRRTVVEERLRQLEQSPDGLAAIRRYFAGVVDFLFGQEHARGCFCTNAAIEMATHDRATAALVAAHQKRMNTAFHQVLLRASQRGEIQKHQDLSELAVFLTSVTQGLAVVGKASLDRAAMQSVVRVALSCLTRS